MSRPLESGIWSKLGPCSFLLHWKHLNAVKLDMGVATFVSFLCDGKINILWVKNQGKKLLSLVGRA